MTCNSIGRRCLETKCKRKSLGWKVGINQGVYLENVEDDILAFPTVENHFSDVNYTFVSQVHVK